MNILLRGSRLQYLISTFRIFQLWDFCHLVFCTCRACRPCEFWCVAGDVRAGWTCADIFHICTAWCRGGSSCAARGRSCWRRTCCSDCTCTAWVPACALGCAAGDLPWSQIPEKAIQFRKHNFWISPDFSFLWWILISHGGWASEQLEMLL